MSAGLGKKIRRVSKSQQDTSTQWAVIEHGLQQIYSKNASSLSFEELYRNAYNMVLFRAGDQLYQGTKSYISSVIDNPTPDLARLWKAL